MGVMNPVWSHEATATTTGTAAVTLPNQPHQDYARNFIVNNLGTVTIYFKKSSLASGPDAADNTTGGYRFAVAAGQSHNYLRGYDEKYLYVASASSTAAYTLTVGSGE